MALSSRGRTSMYDENSVHAGKMPVAGVQGSKLGVNGNQVIGKSTGGLKLQQSATNERKILSDISNTKAPSHASFGTPKPSPKPGFVPFRENQTTKVDNIFKSENLPPKAGQSQSSQKAAARIPLRNIVNESAPPSVKENGPEVVQQKPKLKTGAPKRLGSKATAKIRLTDEQLRLADEWAKEDIQLEQIHFTGDDIEALREKMIDAEIEETVALVRNYRGGWLPSATGKPSECNEEDSLRYADGCLKLDRSFDETAFSAARGNDVFDVEDNLRTEDLNLSAMNNSLFLDEGYPSIPEGWTLREEFATAST
ncbi:hypothetical protein MPTK1_2g09350 [Marchantia polymorpha subsp. ruderalis]|nr:hypothetical protein MARPO_0158s0006 [Marchantia polymorpha]PTQ28624.1 hypothetical protein MARPO_0158s0006 [Marchantia polymorpha]BBN01671.1 hypothetical protein Mp_2g09350 [Marchantia polymorpha subsp. ruderalis]BBN01672.1 hypothetical protein Mp_2g09350 [Marchantia polymorpha subsp. ruderalis]|eukprot:PTQ28623.1 hypothetical protein MARPO_0158s0006 [Marchantia polymorpha]